LQEVPLVAEIGIGARAERVGSTMLEDGIEDPKRA